MNASVRPLVSIVMPAYNHEAFVELAVRSVWEQTWDNIELIVLDDGSSDRTPGILRELAARSPIPMRVICKENEGVCRTLNRGIALAKGEWWAGIASDDFYHPSRIEVQVRRALELGDEYGCIHSDAYMVDLSGTIYDTVRKRSPMPPATGSCFLDLVLCRADMAGGTVMVRTDLLRRIGAYDEQLASEDYDLHLRLARATRIGYVAEPLTHIRTVPNSYGQSPGRWVEDGLRIIAKHRDALNDSYTEALRLKCLRNVAVCTFHGHFRGAVRYTTRAVRYTRSPAAAVHTSRMLLATYAGYAFKRVVAPSLPIWARERVRARFARYIVT
jgi:glycosyltransferase involved in cell wall biosynthesis